MLDVIHTKVMDVLPHAMAPNQMSVNKYPVPSGIRRHIDKKGLGIWVGNASWGSSAYFKMWPHKARDPDRPSWR